MDSIRAYVLSIIAAALICAALEGLLQGSSVKELIKIICGMVLTITVVAPLRNFNWKLPAQLDTSFQQAADAAAAEGETIAREAMVMVIKQKTEAYIQDKAASLGADISAEISLSHEDPPVPQSAVITGQITNSQKSQLLQILQTHLGITKENIKWTG